MNADILLDDTFPHSTPEGYARGCRGGICPGHTPCRDVRRRYIGDFTFRRLFDSGLTAEQIEQQEQEAARAAAEAARAAARAERAARRTKAPRAPRKRRSGPAATTGPVTDLQREIAALHSEGLSDRQMGDRMGKTREQVRAIRRHLNLPANSGPTTIDHVRTLNAQGHDDVEIARQLGKEVGYIAMLRRKAKLPLIPAKRTKLDRDEFIRLHGLGYTDQEIADHFDVPRVVAQKRRANLKLAVNKAPAAPGLSHSQETA